MLQGEFRNPPGRQPAQQRAGSGLRVVTHAYSPYPGQQQQQPSGGAGSGTYQELGGGMIQLEGAGSSGLLHEVDDVTARTSSSLTALPVIG